MGLASRRDLGAQKRTPDVFATTPGALATERTEQALDDRYSDSTKCCGSRFIIVWSDIKTVAQASPWASILCLSESPRQFYHQTIIRLAMVMTAIAPSELMMTGGPQAARSIADRGEGVCQLSGCNTQIEN
jgi:hypothetical protein